MKNQSETFVVVFIKGGKTIHLDGEASVSESMLDHYKGATKACLFVREGYSTRELDRVSK